MVDISRGIPRLIQGPLVWGSEAKKRGLNRAAKDDFNFYGTSHLWTTSNQLRNNGPLERAIKRSELYRLLCSYIKS